MIDKELKNKLIKCKELNEFRRICLEKDIRTTDMDEETLKHFSRLGHGGSAYNHSDPRWAFK